MRCSCVLVALIALCCPPAFSAEAVWPGKAWGVATPQSQGMNPHALDAAANYAMKHGGGSGCIIRHGYLVKEWGRPDQRADIKSAAKGSVGTTILGLAFDDRLIELDDRAQEHYPQIGREKPENAAHWLERITLDRKSVV